MLTIFGSEGNARRSLPANCEKACGGRRRGAQTASPEIARLRNSKTAASAGAGVTFTMRGYELPMASFYPQYYPWMLARCFCVEPQLRPRSRGLVDSDAASTSPQAIADSMAVADSHPWKPTSLAH